MRWFWRKDKAESADQPTWLQVVQSYGAVLAEAQVGLGGSRSSAELPHDKATIKAALIEAANQEGISEEQLGMLGLGYVELASFREGGGWPGVLQNEDPRQMDKNQITELARRISEGGNQEVEMAEVVAAESKVLLDEWKALQVKRGRSNA